MSGWREVVALFEEFGDAYELARAQVVLASVLRAAGDPAEAREVGDAAREGARRLGATPLIDQLRAIGSAPARHEAGSDVLTPREAEILQHVAAGRTNGEIGKQLFISTKTVSVHVSNILGKLGASGPHRGRRDRPASRARRLTRLTDRRVTPRDACLPRRRRLTVGSGGPGRCSCDRDRPVPPRSRRISSTADLATQQEDP